MIKTSTSKETTIRSRYWPPMRLTASPSSMPIRIPPTSEPHNDPNPPKTTTVKLRKSQSEPEVGLKPYVKPNKTPPTAEATAASPKVSAYTCWTLIPSDDAASGSSEA